MPAREEPALGPPSDRTRPLQPASASPGHPLGVPRLGGRSARPTPPSACLPGIERKTKMGAVQVRSGPPRAGAPRAGARESRISLYFLLWLVAAPFVGFVLAGDHVF